MGNVFETSARVRGLHEAEKESGRVMKCPQCNNNELEEFIEEFIDGRRVVLREKLCIVCTCKNFALLLTPLPDVEVSQDGKVHVDWSRLDSET